VQSVDDATVVRLRLFAAARAAAGASEVTVHVADPATIGAALAGIDAEGFGEVAARCSFLVNGFAVTDRGHPLVHGDVVDVMPPFAGG
jgi:sulfur-carrier protein